MTVTPAVAAYVPTYASRNTYITVDEWTDAPTGVDWSQLVPGGSTTDQQAALERTIRRACAWADSICHQVLAATTDVQAGRYRLRNDGSVHVPCDYTPIVYVTGVSIGLTPSTMGDLADLGDVWVGRKVVEIPVSSGGPRPYVKLTYVNGWANTTLADAAASGDTSITVTDAAGITPGLPMLLDGDTGPVEVIVAATHTIGETTVPLTAGLDAAHDAGASVSALPPGIKQAVISLTSCLIKVRGSDAVVMDTMTGQPTREQAKDAGALDEYDTAMAMLNDHVRVW